MKKIALMFIIAFCILHCNESSDDSTTTNTTPWVEVGEDSALP